MPIPMSRIAMHRHLSFSLPRGCRRGTDLTHDLRVAENHPTARQICMTLHNFNADVNAINSKGPEKQAVQLRKLPDNSMNSWILKRVMKYQNKNSCWFKCPFGSRVSAFIAFLVALVSA